MRPRDKIRSSYDSRNVTWEKWCRINYKNRSRVCCYSQSVVRVEGRAIKMWNAHLIP